MALSIHRGPVANEIVLKYSGQKDVFDKIEENRRATLRRCIILLAALTIAGILFVH